MMRGASAGITRVRATRSPSRLDGARAAPHKPPPVHADAPASSAPTDPTAPSPAASFVTLDATGNQHLSGAPDGRRKDRLTLASEL